MHKQMHKHVRIVHHVPGRARLKILHAKANPELCCHIEEIGETISGIKAVKTNPVTGSILVHYDETVPDIRDHFSEAVAELDKFISLMMLDADDMESSDDGKHTGKSFFPDYHYPPLIREFAASVKASSDLKIGEIMRGAAKLEMLLPLLLVGGVFLLDVKNKALIAGAIAVMSLRSRGASERMT